MIWMTWQQHRLQALIAGAALALLALFLLSTGLHMAADYQQMGGVSCARIQSVRCNIPFTFQENYNNTAFMLMLLLMLIPPVVGILVGAPLVAREVEQGTYLLAWTQGITRQRWLMIKLAAILLAGILFETCVTLFWTWWQAFLYQFQISLSPLLFDVNGFVPVASMLFALSLAIAAGTVVRRTIPAMGITIVLYLTILLPVISLRYSVLPPTIVTWDSFTQTTMTTQEQGWVMTSGIMDHQMHIVSNVVANNTCIVTQNYQNYTQCLHNHGWLNYTAYQPTSNFWPLQGIEAGLLFVLSIALIAFTIWWIRYRIH